MSDEILDVEGHRVEVELSKKYVLLRICEPHIGIPISSAVLTPAAAREVAKQLVEQADWLDPTGAP